MNTPLTILYGGHRKVMRIGANENMSTVLRMACREFGLDDGSPLVLKHKRKVVDLSQPFRFTGIPQNATLEIEKGASRGARSATESATGRGQVRVAMRLPGGRRVQASFPCETTLAGLLRSWADGGEIDPAVLHQGPSLQFMRSAYSEEGLESTTLRSIGLTTGSAMFTLSLSPGSASLSVPRVPAAAMLAGADSDPNPSKSAQGQDHSDPAIALGLVDASKPRGNVDDSATATTGTTPSPDEQADATPIPTAAPASGRQSNMPPPPISMVETAGATAEAVDLDGALVESRAIPEAAGSEADEMEVVGEPREPARPCMGISVCTAALEAMAAGHFDADSSACVVTLARIVDNVVHRPDEARTRQLRCSNSAFHQKVGRIRGGIEFLEGIGFVSKSEDLVASAYSIGSTSGSGGRMLVLPSDREDQALLKEARVLLDKHAVILGVPRDKMPQPPRQRPTPGGAGAASSPEATFDPYKPFISSTTPTPKGQEEQSLTEKRLQALLEKRASVVAGGIPERNIQVTFSSQAAASIPAPVAGKEGGRIGGGGSREISAMEGVTTAEDRALITKKVVRQTAERKKQEATPFQTKAMREIERLQKATVYRTTIIKIQFPDRAILQATFSSTEGVKDLEQLVRESFGESYRERKFQLYVSPPRTVLKETSSLSEAGLVPAALVYVSWKNVPPPGEAEGAYLKVELVCVGGSSSSVARPVGVSLEEGGEGGGAEASKLQAGTRASMGAKKTRSGGGSKKPGWLKIN